MLRFVFGRALPLSALTLFLSVGINSACSSNDTNEDQSGWGGLSQLGGSAGLLTQCGGNSEADGDLAGAEKQRWQATAQAEFKVELRPSEVVKTVVTVLWSVDRPIKSARVQFGRHEDFPEYEAPVDLNNEQGMSVLLGMKENAEYEIVVVAQGCDDEILVSDPVVWRSGYLPNLAPRAVVADHNEGKLYDGFTLSCNGYGNARQIDPNGESSWAMIMDKDGSLVWAYNLTETPEYGCNRARMSHDGKHMWMGNSSFARPTGALRRVSMDGAEFRDYLIPGRHHDFTVLPNGHILYPEQQNGGGGAGASEGADNIMQLDPETGESILVYDQNSDFADAIAPVGAHTNHITYIPELQAFSFSLLYLNTIALLSYPDAELLGVFGGPRDEFGISWDAQHGHHFSADSLLVFNNWVEPGVSGTLEFTYDLNEKTIGAVSRYVPQSRYGTIAFGDVGRLPNGNTLVTFSSNGVIQELDEHGQLLREITLPTPIGYATRRATLYGPPPHLSEN